MRVHLATKKAAPEKGERVRVCGLVYYVAHAEQPDALGDGTFVGEYDIQPADGGKGSKIYDAQMIYKENA